VPYRCRGIGKTFPNQVLIRKKPASLRGLRE
jgi:hypothetical protein